jgi:nitrite reductase/ring-hydroxylating ferredoxin subunit
VTQVNARPVARVADVPPGTIRRVEHNGDDILLANVDGEILAVGGECSHDGAPLSEGDLEGATIVCPWHFSRFCLRTGSVLESPAVSAIESHPVRVDGDDVHLA